MARHGNAAQRNAALNTLALDATHRAQRMTMQLLAAAPRQVVTGVAPHVNRTIYTAGNQETKPGQLVRSEGQAPGLWIPDRNPRIACCGNGQAAVLASGFSGAGRR